MKLKIFLLTAAITTSAYPFSVKEIENIPNITLKKPSVLKTSDSIELAYYNFANPENKKIILFYPGAGMYGNKPYQLVAQTLQEKYNIGCYIFDIRGHGNSAGSRGDGPSIKRILTDISEAIACIQQNHPDATMYIAGHGTGATLAMNYAATIPNTSEHGYILLTPYLGLQIKTLKEHKNTADAFISKIKAWVYSLGSIFPTGFPAHLNATYFNYSQELLTTDPLIVPSYSFTMSMATTPSNLKSLLEKINKPIAIFMSQEDTQIFQKRLFSSENVATVPINITTIDDVSPMMVLQQAPQYIAEYIKTNS